MFATYFRTSKYVRNEIHREYKIDVTYDISKFGIHQSVKASGSQQLTGCEPLKRLQQNMSSHNVIHALRSKIKVVYKMLEHLQSN